MNNLQEKKEAIGEINRHRLIFPHGIYMFLLILCNDKDKNRKIGLLKPAAHGEQRAEQTPSRGGLLIRSSRVRENFVSKGRQHIALLFVSLRFRFLSVS